MSTLAKPWLQDVNVTAVRYNKTAAEEVAELLKTLIDNDVEDALAMATSPDDDDAITGSVRYDRVLLAAAVKKLATDEHPQVQERNVKQISALINRASKKIGVDRVAIAARKAELLGLTQAPAEQPQWSPNQDN